MNAAEPMLSIQGLTVSYDGIAAVKGISFDALPGEIVAIVGANGAGKTSTLRAISGLTPWGGSIVYQGESLRGVAVHQIVERGIAHVPEGRAIFGDFTVMENLRLASWVCRSRPVLWQAMERVFTLFPRLKDRREQSAGTLSGGEQQMLALSRALLASPKLLLLDEPSMGLAPLMVQKVFEVVRRIAAEGVTILLVEQNARLALEVCSRGYVMESGSITLADSSAALLADSRVRKAYLGE